MRYGSSAIAGASEITDPIIHLHKEIETYSIDTLSWQSILFLLDCMPYQEVAWEFLQAGLEYTENSPCLDNSRICLWLEDGEKACWLSAY